MSISLPFWVRKKKIYPYLDMQQNLRFQSLRYYLSSLDGPAISKPAFRPRRISKPPIAIYNFGLASDIKTCASPPCTHFGEKRLFTILVSPRWGDTAGKIWLLWISQKTKTLWQEVAIFLSQWWNLSLLRTPPFLVRQNRPILSLWASGRTDGRTHGHEIEKCVFQNPVLRTKSKKTG